MRTDIKEFTSLRNAIYKEKARIEARLREINQVLSANGAHDSSAPPPNLSRPQRAGHGRGRRNPFSLKEAVLQVTRARPLTKHEILVEVQRLGYKFATSDPLNSLGVILYGKNPKFRNQDGRFSPV